MQVSCIPNNLVNTSIGPNRQPVVVTRPCVGNPGQLRTCRLQVAASHAELEFSIVRINGLSQQIILKSLRTVALFLKGHPLTIVCCPFADLRGVQILRMHRVKGSGMLEVCADRT